MSDKGQEIQASEWSGHSLDLGLSHQHTEIHMDLTEMEGEEGCSSIPNTDPDEPPQYGRGLSSFRWQVTVRDIQMLAEERGIHDTACTILENP